MTDLRHWWQQDTSADIAMEVTNYTTMKCASSDIEPLAFWQQHSWRFPVLSKLAELYLSMSSASVPVQAMFSTTSFILHGKRSLLAPDKLNRISFIHDNYAYLLKNNEREWFLITFPVTLSLISSMWTWLFDLDINISIMQYLLSFVKSIPPDLV